MRLKGGAVETIYIGVDFHARQQTICYLTTEPAELVTCELKHQDKEAVGAFYAAFSGRRHRGPGAVVTSLPCVSRRALLGEAVMKRKDQRRSLG